MKFLNVFLLLFIFSCSHDGHNHANKHMHKKSHAELIKSFNDPARDKWQRPQIVLLKMGDLHNRNVIDIGSGSGYFTKYFIQANAQVTAADVDERFLDYIKMNLKSSNLFLKRIRYDDPLMGKDQFDMAFTCNTYHHIDNRVGYFRKVLKGLRKGGKLVVVDFKKENLNVKVGPPLSMRIDVNEVRKELELAGFKNIQIDHNSLTRQYIVIAYKQN